MKRNVHTFECVLIPIGGSLRVVQLCCCTIAEWTVNLHINLTETACSWDGLTLQERDEFTEDLTEDKVTQQGSDQRERHAEHAQR